MKGNKYSALLISAATLALITGAPAFGQDAPQSDPQGMGVADIVVTAQKREQRLQDVPVSITALTTDALRSNRIANVADLNAVAPNLTVRESGGGGGIPNITMRGALSIGVGPGADREVGFYVDGVYVGHALGSMFELANVERIEVLRGPQGTLFGRNATAGAISFITRNPKGSFDLEQEFTVGNYDQFRSKTRIDLPAFGPFSAALTYVHSERRGETRNLGAGKVWDYGVAGLGLRTSPKWLGSENKEIFSAALSFEPSSTFSTTYKFDYLDSHATPVAIGFPGFGPDFGTGLEGLYGAQPDPSILTPVSKHRPDAVNNEFTTSTDLKISTHNLTSEWAISDDIKLKNVFGHRRVRQTASQELGALGGMVIPGANLPITIYGTTSAYRHNQVSDELQLNYTGKLANITTGVLYYHQTQGLGGPTGLPNQYFFQVLPGGVLTCPLASSCRGPSPTRGTSKAAYIQVEGHVTSQLDIVGGYRITGDKKSGGFSDGPFAVKDTNSSYLAGVNYKPTNDILLFGKYSTAFMSGGGNTGNFLPGLRTYAPEKAYSWELGAKTDWFDRRLRVNLSLFSVKYKDIQWIIGGQTCGDVLEGVCVFTLGDARAKGFELEVTAVPVQGLTLNAGVGYTDFKYKNVAALATAGTGFFSPSYRPDWTANLSAQYDTPEIDSLGGGHLSFRLDGNFRTKALLAADPAPQYQPIVTIPSVWIVNSRIALSDVDLAGHKAEIALWARNLTNDDHMVMASSFYFAYPTVYERARTFGVDVKFDW